MKSTGREANSIPNARGYRLIPKSLGIDVLAVAKRNPTSRRE
jgi:hypothetical protein